MPALYNCLRYNKELTERHETIIDDTDIQTIRLKKQKMKASQNGGNA